MTLQSLWRWVQWVRSLGDPLPTFPIGQFAGQPAVVWLGPRNYRTITAAQGEPFRFIRSNGEVIEVGTMDTDDASIPSALWSIPGMDPEYFAPAARVHDWLFACHHQGDNSTSFTEANQILMEGIDTLLSTGISPRTRWTELDRWLIWEGINTPRCRDVWDGLAPVMG